MDLKVQMSSRRPTGRSDISDDLPLLDVVARRDYCMIQMRIQAAVSVAMADAHIVTVDAVVCGNIDVSSGDRIDGRSLRCGKIHAGMHTIVAIDRMLPIAIGIRHAGGTCGNGAKEA